MSNLPQTEPAATESAIHPDSPEKYLQNLMIQSNLLQTVSMHKKILSLMRLKQRHDVRDFPATNIEPHSDSDDAPDDPASTETEIPVEEPTSAGNENPR